MEQQPANGTPFDDHTLTTSVEPVSNTGEAAPGHEPAAGAEEISSTQLSLRKRLLNWRTLVPLVIVLALLAYTAQKLQINPALTWDAIRSANLFLFLAAFVTYYLSFPLRTLRWRLLLENAGIGSQPRFPRLLTIVYISWFANAIVPAKLGDLYRAYLLRQEAGVSATRTFGTVLAERLLDLSVLLCLFLGSTLLSLHASLPPFLSTGLYLTLAIVGLGIAGLFLLRIYRSALRRFIPPRFQGHYDHLQEGTLGSFKRIPLLSLLTIAVWLCEGGRFFFIALALNLLPGSLPHIAVVSMFIALGEALLTIVPFTSGGIGLVEGGMLGMLALFTAARNLGAAAVLLDRTISLFSILLIGLLVFLLTAGRRASRQGLLAQKP